MMSQNNHQKTTHLVSVDDGEQQFTLDAHDGENLLDIFQKNGRFVLAPCGGKKNCRKCEVNIAGRGIELACDFAVNEDIQVAIPDSRKFVILEKLNPHVRQVKASSGFAVVDFGVQQIVSYKDKTIAMLPKSNDYKKRIYGVAVDIGTTTVVMYLIDLLSGEDVGVTSFINPQATYGADVISRIQYCMENDGALSLMQDVIIEQLNHGITRLCAEAKVERDDIFAVSFVGNTVMLHLLLATDPTSIAHAPFTPVFTEAKILKSADISLNINKHARIHVLPSVAGYVGADIVAGVAATDMADSEKFSLYIDIGTNGEIALGNRDKIFSCATAAGPAFEGARIQCGVGGIEGAISGYADGTYQTIGDKKPVGICGSGLIDIIGDLIRLGTIGIMGMAGEPVVIAPQIETVLDHDIVITPKDVSEVQLAKSAIYTGIKIMMKEAGITFDQIDKLYLAGGFGNYINVKNAIQIGMLPAELHSKIIPIGNNAGTGAQLALKSVDFEREVQKVIDKSQYIELSGRPDFNDEFVNAMMFEDVEV